MMSAGLCMRRSRPFPCRLVGSSSEMAERADRSAIPICELRFETVEACACDVERIIEADRGGTLHAHGNWTAGKVMAHVAAWIE